MKRPKHLARQIQQKYRLSHPTLDNMIFLIEQQNYELVDFDPSSESFHELCHEIGYEYSGSPAFVYTSKNARMVFLKSTLSVEEQRIVLAHELGHILCEHQSSSASAMEEYEAQEFAYHLLHPPVFITLRNQLLNRKYLVAAAVVMIAMLAVGGHYLYHSRYSNYYVSENGTKYHMRNCLIIHDRVGLRRLTWDEVNSEIYEPCGVCLKNP